jgi:hypothetical protein
VLEGYNVQMSGIVCFDCDQPIRSQTSCLLTPDIVYTHRRSNHESSGVCNVILHTLADRSSICSPMLRILLFMRIISLFLIINNYMWSKLLRKKTTVKQGRTQEDRVELNAELTHHSLLLITNH